MQKSIGLLKSVVLMVVRLKGWYRRLRRRGTLGVGVGRRASGCTQTYAVADADRGRRREPCGKPCRWPRQRKLWRSVKRAKFDRRAPDLTMAEWACVLLLDLVPLRDGSRG
jgi:hypothetical protein